MIMQLFFSVFEPFSLFSFIKHYLHGWITGLVQEQLKGVTEKMNGKPILLAGPWGLYCTVSPPKEYTD